MDSNNIITFIVGLVTYFSQTNLVALGFKTVSIITMVLFNIWSIVTLQEVRKLNYNYRDDQNYLLFVGAYLQMLIGGILFLYAVFLL